MITDNPLNDFYEHDADAEEWLNQLPVCGKCGKSIQDDYGYIYGGELLCQDCWDKLVKEEIRVDMDDLIEN